MGFFFFFCFLFSFLYSFHINVYIEFQWNWSWCCMIDRFKYATSNSKLFLFLNMSNATFRFQWIWNKRIYFQTKCKTNEMKTKKYLKKEKENKKNKSVLHGPLQKYMKIISQDDHPLAFFILLFFTFFCFCYLKIK